MVRPQANRRGRAGGIDTSIPDYQTLMMPVLELASKGETPVPLAEAEIAARFSLSNEEREQMLRNGKLRVLHNRIHWAKFYLTKAGLLESPKRGRFAITAAGQKILANPPTKLDTQYLLIIPAFREFYRSGEGDDATSPTTEETAFSTMALITVVQAGLRGGLGRGLGKPYTITT